MATRNVVLTESQSELVDRLITSGRYKNAGEALRGDLVEGSGEDAVRRVFRADLLP